jgi:cation/acetate symporter
VGIRGWTWLIVVASFAIYVGVAVWGKARSVSDFYVADTRVHPILNGMATGADWMSAASFISMGGLIAFLGRDGSSYLMGWTGGYVLLAILLAPYLRKYGKYTVPQFVGDRYYSSTARVVALGCAVLVSFIYVAGQVRGVGIVFSRFLGTSVEAGVLAGLAIVFVYAGFGGMRGTTYAQVAHYVMLIVAYLVPAIFTSFMLTGNPIPQLGYGSTISAEGAEFLGGHRGEHLLDVLNRLVTDLGFARYTDGSKPRLDVFMITLALMAGTAGLPHIIVRFFTVPKIRDARAMAGWALVFIGLLYTSVPAVAAFARTALVTTVHGKARADAPSWLDAWERTGLVAWTDLNGDGVMQVSARATENELAIDHDVMVLASPEMARLPAWVIALVAAGALAAAISSAAGLLLVIAAAISHDLMKGIVMPRMSERAELWWARCAVGATVIVAGYFGVHPPAHVAQVVAFAFGLAASSFFPVITMGIFWKRATREGAIAGMLTGVLFTLGYIVHFELIHPELNGPASWWLGISPEGIGTVGMLLNFTVTWAVSLVTRAPPQAVQEMVVGLRYPKESEPFASADAGARQALR